MYSQMYPLPLWPHILKNSVLWTIGEKINLDLRLGAAADLTLLLTTYAVGSLLSVRSISLPGAKLQS